ncbi:class I SAM-dependent methyltransferase [Streptomyces aidingensis]|uniref:Methyltransferase domain-containing protein n=1 Tax=Streptomyces aidingensis TaxID=910347 RepID=A0A1I1TUV2_9ACTN|nr:class I SAM-dependent methyltransferase [Streptomyces aidingensis]SFD59340.1 Methyltransferase domain-containing protein [Streptomyces aidingensis]
MDSRAWDERYAAAELVWGREPNRWVARETAGLPPGRALDLAAGEGRNALWLAGRGWRVTAADFSAVAVERGRKLAAAGPPEAAGRVGWVRADVTEAGSWAEWGRGNGFDLVLISYLHLPPGPRREVWRRAARVLAPGGTLLVIGHDATNIEAGTGGPQDPEVLYSPDEVVSALAGSGLRTVLAERVRRPVEGAARDAVDALVRLRSEPSDG